MNTTSKLYIVTIGIIISIVMSSCTPKEEKPLEAFDKEEKPLEAHDEERTNQILIACETECTSNCNKIFSGNDEFNRSARSSCVPSCVRTCVKKATP